MRLYEFQAKRILAQSGLPVPDNRLITSVEGLEEVTTPTVLKAQILAGGRGKAGGIRKISDPIALRSAATELLGTEIRGHPVQAVLTETPVAIKKEFYLACLLDKHAGRPLLMTSPAGGIDIEEVARENPERISKTYFDLFVGLQAYEIRSIAKSLGTTNVKGLTAIVRKICFVFQRFDATLIEINPLADTADGLVALDAKIILDDKAAFRQTQLFDALKAENKSLESSRQTKTEALATKEGINYIPLDGDIGMIADGAGTGMLTLDMICDSGGRPANFCEMGGLSNADVMRRSIRVVLSDERVKILVISLIGGLTRMDEMAAGIVAYLESGLKVVPIVIRMCGTMSHVGTPMLKAAGLEVYEDLADTIAAAMRHA